MMKTILKLLERTFDIWAKKNWLRTIDKELTILNRLQSKVSRQKHIVNELVKKYNSIYHNDTIAIEPKKENENE